MNTALENPFPGYMQTTFTHDGVTKRVWEKGSGPAVIVMAEMPGNTPAVVAFADRLVENGYAVIMPYLFGKPGAAPSILGYLKEIPLACVSKEFISLKTGKTSPITTWLRALAADAWERYGGPGVGAVGMCWTGGFALGMMVDEHVIAPVLSQPSLPIALPWSKENRSDLGLSPEDLEKVKERVHNGACVLALRFTGDPLCQGEKFQRLRDELGEGCITVEIDSSKGNVHGIPKSAHSVLTENFVDDPSHPTFQALTQVLDFFHERLQVQS